MTIHLYKRGGMTRKEFMSRVGADKEVDPLVDLAYKLLNERDFAAPNKGAADEHLWHTSFHGSQFPGDDKYPCGRQALYRMMDVPRSPVTRRGRQFMDAGKDIEDRLVWAWYHAGFLVSNPPISADGKRQQTRFEDPDHWLTSTVDSLLLKPREQRPFAGEVKNIGSKALEEMRKLIRGPNEAHVRQLKCQIGMAHEYGPMTVKRCYNTGLVAVSDKDGLFCPQHKHAKCLHEETLLPVIHGRLYYVSRDDPMDTFEYMYEYDPQFMAQGRRMLENWREWFLTDRLPQTQWENKRYSHPFGWRWTLDEYPCKWCEYGDICRDDHDVAKKQGGPIKLTDSALVEVAQRFRPEWDYEKIKLAVYERWGLEQEKSANSGKAANGSSRVRVSASIADTV